MTAARTVAISIFALLALAPLSAYADGISFTQYTVAPATIYPGTTNGGLATTTTITVGFSERVSAHVTIEDSTGSVVRSLYSSNGVTNPTPKVWDGTDSGGAVVAPALARAAADNKSELYAPSGKRMELAFDAGGTRRRECCRCFRLHLCRRSLEL